MADKTKIEWTNATWNPIRGCSVVSEGCRNCYAMHVAARFAGEGQAYEGLAYRNSSGVHWSGKVMLVEKHLEDPLRWQRPRRIFVNSMSDLFHPGVSDEWIDQIFAVMACAGQHTFQVLTKRPERMLAYLQQVSDERDMQRWINAGLDVDLGPPPSSWEWPLPNVWLGVSVEDQKTADERLPLLLETPAAVRWVSAEPLLGPLDLERWLCSCPVRCEHNGGSINCSLDGYLEWLVVGGESGPGARPMHPEWARSLRDQCTRAGVPFFFKQGSKANWSDYKDFQSFPTDLQIREYPKGASDA